MPDSEEELLTEHPITVQSRSKIVDFLIKKNFLKNEASAELTLLSCILATVLLVAILWGVSVIRTHTAIGDNPNALLSGITK